MSFPMAATPTASTFMPGSPALVMFVGETTIPWLRVLRKGFRHCFVAINSGDLWLVYDPLAHRTDLTVLQGFADGQLAEWYRHHGILVVPTAVEAPPAKLAPVRPFSCVEAVKRVLGIHSPWVVTPWQLYRLLTGPVVNRNNNLTMA